MRDESPRLGLDRRMIFVDAVEKADEPSLMSPCWLDE
jgi:hypothetical protein